MRFLQSNIRYGLAYIKHGSLSNDGVVKMKNLTELVCHVRCLILVFYCFSQSKYNLYCLSSALLFATHVQRHRIRTFVVSFCLKKRFCLVFQTKVGKTCWQVLKRYLNKKQNGSGSGAGQSVVVCGYAPLTDPRICCGRIHDRLLNRTFCFQRKIFT